MWMSDYVREIKRQLRDRYGFVPDGGTADDPTFSDVPNGEYPMEIEGRLDRVKVVDGRFRFGNFEEPETPKSNVEGQELDYDYDGDGGPARYRRG